MVKKNMYRRLLVLLTALSSTCVLYPAYVPWNEAAPFDLLPDFLPGFNGDSGCQQGAKEFTCEDCKRPCPNRAALDAHWINCAGQVSANNLKNWPVFEHLDWVSTSSFSTSYDSQEQAGSGQVGFGYSEDFQDEHWKDDITLFHLEPGHENNGGEPANEALAVVPSLYQPLAQYSQFPFLVPGRQVPAPKRPHAEIPAESSHKKARVQESERAADLQPASDFFGTINIREAKPFESQEGGERFTMTTDMSSHTGIESFSCQACGKMCGQRSDLTKHMRKHTGAKPYACPVCHQRFSQNSNVSTHIRKRHPEHVQEREPVREDAREKPFECEVCLRRFTRKPDLNRHMETHNRPKKVRESRQAKKQRELEKARALLNDVWPKEQQPQYLSEGEYHG